MTTEKIREIYAQYRNTQKQTMKLEEELLAASDQDEWLQKLSQKSTFLRSAYQENEDMLAQYIHPFLQKKQPLTVELAKEFLNQIIDMEMSAENDSLLTTEVLKLLKEYFAENALLEEEILSTFFLGISYADRVNLPSREKARRYFEEVCRLADSYCSIGDWDIRRRILFSFYNRLTNYDMETASDPLEIFTILEDAYLFFSRSDVRALDKDNIDFDELIKECVSSVQWSLSCTDVAPSPEVLELVKKHFLPAHITEDNLLTQKSCDALIYIWYRYRIGEYDCNKTLSLLYQYYLEKDKEIDYSDIRFYEDENYQVQMIYMQECFRYLALPDCTLPNRQSIMEDLIADFTKLYESIPYLENNAYLNMDMLEIMNFLLRSVTDEEKAFHFIRKVAIRRNAMTLIHSTMVAQITRCITDCLVEKAPRLFYELLSVDNAGAVREKREYLSDYIGKAAYIHDIGKIMFSDIINLQTRKLTDEEFVLIKSHPSSGAKLLRKTGLSEKFDKLILGHHKFYDGTGGYPDTFVNTEVKEKILIDILTIGDCIDAATDMLGRNYAAGKTWFPTVQNELLSDDSHRYNREIIETVCSDGKVCNEIQYLTGLGRVKTYYDIYRTYLSK